MGKYRDFWNEEMETLSPAEFQGVQEEALFKQLKYIRENSPFYRDKFGAEGIDLADVTSIEYFEKLPFTMKQELRDSQADSPPLGKHAAVPMEKVTRVYSTSGTTGRPTYIGLTQEDFKTWTEATSRSLWCGGFRPDMVIPSVQSPFMISASYVDAIANIGSTSVPIGVNATDRLIGAYQNLGGNAVLSTSSFPIHFADSLRKRGLDPESMGIRRILAGGEPGASIPEYRKAVEETFGCLFLEMMGNGDMCSQMWSECEHKRGMHFIAQGIVYYEIIDPDTGKVQEAKEGTKGELVYTALQRECLPLVRFRTRDHVEVTQTSCGCGRTGIGIRCIGRTDDMIIVQGINVYPAAVKDVVAAFAPRTNGAIEIQIEKAPPEGWQPPIWVKAEVGDDSGDREELKQAIQAMIREKLIFRANIELVEQDALPKYEYKAKLVRKVYEDA